MNINQQLTNTIFRLLDVLEEVEYTMQSGNAHLELTLCANQAKKALLELESMVGIDLKTFLKNRSKKLAKNETMN